MQAKRWIGALVLGFTVLAGCAKQQNPVSLENGLILMQTGAPILTCRDACLTDWRREQPQAQQLEAAGRWRDLATLLIRVGYQDDLSLYYLGRAAEGLGFAAGAAKYYAQSKELSGTTISCANMSKLCGGLAFPQAAALRLSAVTLQMERSRRAAPVPAPQTKPVPAAAEGVAPGAPTPHVTPLPPEPAPPPAPAPSPPPRPADTRDFIEPPPAQR